jgi:NAD(P)-dependent dehydrogenase (short-subunit alcohol dehydrogenase family)
MALETQLDGTYVVTGGASGLGAAVVRGVAAAGGRPVVLDRARPMDEVDHHVVDLADRDATLSAMEAALASGDVRGVVTCAGIDVPGAFTRVSAADWERVIAVNLVATATVVRAALPQLKEHGGRVVTVSSTLGHRAAGDATAYCASKFGVVGFTRALTAELRGRVGVTLLTPGGMQTAFFDDREEQYRPPPDARLSDPAHVADVVVFALSRPADVELKEVVVASPWEASWP